MNITKHRVATINYRLQDDAGVEIDSSEGGEPLAYIHGVGMLVPGLEKALEGQTAGNSVDVVVQPEEGYGERDERLVIGVPREQFEDPAGLQVGQRVQAESPQGVQVLHVVAMDEESITLDANHPLAGTTLHFHVDVVEVRDATAEELEHGHVHGPGGHHH